MVGSFDDKVKVWVIFHNSAFLLKYVLEVVEKLQFIWTMQKVSIVSIGLCWLLGGLDRDNAQKISKNS